jgi:hypothetical protein
MAALTPEQEKARKLKYAALEIIDTEQKYSTKLQNVVDVFITPLRQLGIIDNNEILIQFNCVEVLAKLHKEFYDLMLMEKEQETLQLGAIFVEFSDNFKLYKNYLLNFDLALQRRDALTNPDSPSYNKRFVNFISNAEKDPRLNNADIGSLLIEPVQRVPRYKMLLEQLLKYTPETSHEYDLISQSLQKLSDVAAENNDVIKKRENREKITKMMQMIDSRSRVNFLDDPNRLLIRSGPLQRLCE